MKKKREGNEEEEERKKKREKTGIHACSPSIYLFLYRGRTKDRRSRKRGREKQKERDTAQHCSRRRKRIITSFSLPLSWREAAIVLVIVAVTRVDKIDKSIC